MIMNLRYRFLLLKDHAALERTRRRSIRFVARTQASTRFDAVLLALKDLGGAAATHRIRFRTVMEYWKAAVVPSIKWNAGARNFADEIADPPAGITENPLIGAREASVRLVSKKRLRVLQGNIICAAFADWYGLRVSPVQAGILGSFSDVAWVARGLMRSAGLPDVKGTLSGRDRWKLKVVLEPYVRGLQLRRTHLEGDPRPGRTLLAAQTQKMRILRLRKMGFALEGLEVLYPDLLDREELRLRKENIELVRNKWVRLIQARGTGLRFENYLHLQTLVSGAPVRGSERLGRYQAAVEHRHI